MHLLTSGLKVFRYATERVGVWPQQTWFSELRAGCEDCFAPREFHTGEAHFIGANGDCRGCAICREFRE